MNEPAIRDAEFVVVRPADRPQYVDLQPLTRRAGHPLIRVTLWAMYAGVIVACVATALFTTAQ